MVVKWHNMTFSDCFPVKINLCKPLNFLFISKFTIVGLSNLLFLASFFPVANIIYERNFLVSVESVCLLFAIWKNSELH